MLVIANFACTCIVLYTLFIVRVTPINVGGCFWTHHCLHSPSNHVSPTDNDWFPCTHSGGQGPGSHGLCWTSSNWQLASLVSGISDLKWRCIFQHSSIRLSHFVPAHYLLQIYASYSFASSSLHQTLPQYLLTWSVFSVLPHRWHCRRPSWTMSSRSSCSFLHRWGWCRRAPRLRSCSCCSRLGADCLQPSFVRVHLCSHTATASHTPHPAAVHLHTDMHTNDYSYRKHTANCVKCLLQTGLTAELSQLCNIPEKKLF